MNLNCFGFRRVLLFFRSMPTAPTISVFRAYLQNSELMVCVQTQGILPYGIFPTKVISNHNFPNSAENVNFSTKKTLNPFSWILPHTAAQGKIFQFELHCCIFPQIMALRKNNRFGSRSVKKRFLIHNHFYQERFIGLLIISTSCFFIVFCQFDF